MGRHSGRCSHSQRYTPTPPRDEPIEPHEQHIILLYIENNSYGPAQMTSTTHDRTKGTDRRTNSPIDRPEEVSRRTTLGMIGLGALGIAASSPARAAPDEQCFTVNGGIIEGRLTSPTTTEGTLRGAGPLNGSTALAIEALVPSAGLPEAVVSPTTVSYTGCSK